MMTARIERLLNRGFPVRLVADYLKAMLKRLRLLEMNWVNGWGRQLFPLAVGFAF